MVKERKYNQLIKNDTWKVVSSPQKANIITEKYCFKLKKNQFGHILNNQAQLKTHRYKQKEIFTCIKIFTSVVEPLSYECFFAIRARCSYRIRQIDVVMATLYSFFDKVICDE